jgi:hypothetical protein
MDKNNGVKSIMIQIEEWDPNFMFKFVSSSIDGNIAIVKFLIVSIPFSFKINIDEEEISLSTIRKKIIYELQSFDLYDYLDSHVMSEREKDSLDESIGVFCFNIEDDDYFFSSIEGEYDYEDDDYFY